MEYNIKLQLLPMNIIRFHIVIDADEDEVESRVLRQRRPITLGRLIREIGLILETEGVTVEAEDELTLLIVSTLGMPTDDIAKIVGLKNW